MGSGKKRIEIKKIEKESSRMITFSKRRKGLFKKSQDLRDKTGAKVAIVLFSPAGNPYTFGDVSLFEVALKNICTASTSHGLEESDRDFNAIVAERGASATVATGGYEFEQCANGFDAADGFELKQVDQNALAVTDWFEFEKGENAFAGTDALIKWLDSTNGDEISPFLQR